MMGRKGIKGIRTGRTNPPTCSLTALQVKVWQKAAQKEGKEEKV